MSDLQIIAKRSNVEEYRELMHKRVDILCDAYAAYDCPDKNLAMVCIVIVGLDGSYNVSRTISERSFFGNKLSPAIVSEILRLENVEEIAEDVFWGKL